MPERRTSSPRTEIDAIAAATGGDPEGVVARYRAILNSTLDPVVTIDVMGEIQAVSRSIERVFGWRPDELVGRNVNVLMPEPQRDEHDGYLAEYRRTGRTNILGQTRELEALRRDGTRVPIEISVSRVEGPHQEQELFTAIIHDISERKRSERELAASERRFRTILEGIGLVGVMIDADARITFCNDALLQLTGWSREDVLGKDWFDTFVPPDERALVRQVYGDNLARQTVATNFQSTILTESGERRLIDWHNTIVRDERGRAVGVTGLGVDITERRRAEQELSQYRRHLEELVAERTSELESSHEQLRQADRLVSIGTLAAGLGHDMNNVLLPVRCRLDALDVESLSDTARGHVAAVRSSIEYLQQLADGLHLLALDPDDIEASRETTDLLRWWEQVGPLLTKGLPRHVRFTASWSSDLPRLAVAPHRLTQAVLNLIVNAGEAVGGDGRVELSASRDDDAGMVRITVSDNGRGMTADVRRQALDPFFTTKKRGLGTGLGLSLVRGVVRSAGGEIDIDSEVGRGTSVRLSFSAMATPRGAGDGEGDVVLCLDDARLASLVGALVEGAGLAVHHAEPDALPSCGLLVTVPSPRSLAAVKTSYGRFAPPILLLGPIQDGWSTYRPVVVDDPTNFQDIRAAIAKAIQVQS